MTLNHVDKMVKIRFLDIIDPQLFTYEGTSSHGSDVWFYDFEAMEEHADNFLKIIGDDFELKSHWDDFESGNIDAVAHVKFTFLGDASLEDESIDEYLSERLEMHPVEWTTDL